MGNSTRNINYMGVRYYERFLLAYNLLAYNCYPRYTDFTGIYIHAKQYEFNSILKERLSLECKYFLIWGLSQPNYITRKA